MEDTNCTFNVTTLSGPSDPTTLEWYIYIMSFYVTGFLCLCGIIGNVISFIILLQDRTACVTYYLLRAVLVADTTLLLLTSIVYVFPRMHPFTGAFEFLHQNEAYILKWVWPLAMMAHSAAVWTVVTVTVDRYTAVCSPYKARSIRTFERARKKIIAAVLFAVFFNIPRFMDFNVHMHTSCNQTQLVMDEFLHKYPIYTYGYTIALYSLLNIISPLIILCFLNTKLIIALRQSVKRRANIGVRSLDMQREERNVTFMLVVIVVTFIICQTPSIITQALYAAQLQMSETTRTFQKYYVRFANAMVTLNSASNFLVYCIFGGRRFRRLMKATFCKNCPVVEGVPVEPSLSKDATINFKTSVRRVQLLLVATRTTTDQMRTLTTSDNGLDHMMEDEDMQMQNVSLFDTLENGIKSEEV